jgi:hypothetical protein
LCLCGFRKFGERGCVEHAGNIRPTCILPPVEAARVTWARSMSAFVPATTMQVTKIRNVVASDFMAFSGRVAHRRAQHWRKPAAGSPALNH